MEENHPLQDEGGIVQDHEADVGEEGDFVQHLPHDIVFYSQQAYPQLILNRR
jgi:hypothetical protein